MFYLYLSVWGCLERALPGIRRSTTNSRRRRNVPVVPAIRIPTNLCEMKRFFLLVAICISVSSVSSAQDEPTVSDNWENRGTDRFSDMEEDADAWLSAPLSAYGSPFSSVSRYRFSFVRYRRRGYDLSASRAMLNGIELYDPVAGGVYWSVLSALRNVRTEGEERFGNFFSPSCVAGPGEMREYAAGLTADPRSIRVGWFFSDRKFRQGFRLSFRSGEFAGRWSVALDAVRRWGYDRHVRGVFADAWTLFGSVSVRPVAGHVLSLVFLEAPSEQGLRSASTAEAFDLRGDRLYNPAWGDWQGKVRAARVRTDRMPMALLCWRFSPGGRFSLTASVSGLWGESAVSSPEWYDASNPYPDYYRYMPGFYADPAVAGAVREAWSAGDGRYTQIDWNELYRTNDPDGAARYAIGSSVNRYRHFQAAVFFSYRLSSRTELGGGVRGRLQRTERFRRLEDLLGAAYVADIDPYLSGDPVFGDRAENDLRYPGRRVGAGEKYSYFYDLICSRYEGWGTFSSASRNGRWSGNIGFRTVRTVFFREGRFEKALFPGAESYGRSPAVRFTDYRLSGGIRCRISPRHLLGLDLFCGSEAPEADDVFLSPDYRRATVDGPRSECDYGAEWHYRFSGRWLTLSFSGYATSSRNGSRVYRYYDDLASSYCEMALSGMDRTYAGIELGTEIVLSPRLSFFAAVALSRDSFRNDPQAAIYSDRDGGLIERSVSRLKGFFVGESPQRNAAAELRYAGRKMWTASVSVACVGDRYLSPAPSRRMRRAYDYALSGEEVIRLAEQERLPEAFTLDLFLSKTFDLGGRYLSLSGSISNLLDRRDIVYGGYESMRLRVSGADTGRSIAPFASKYLYAYGRTYYLSVNFRFR